MGCKDSGMTERAQNYLQSFCPLCFGGRQCRHACFLVCTCFFCVSIYHTLLNHTSFLLWDQSQISPSTLLRASSLRTFFSCQTSQSLIFQILCHLHPSSYARSYRSKDSVVHLGKPVWCSGNTKQRDQSLISVEDHGGCL